MSVGHAERLLPGTANAHSRPKAEIGRIGKQTLNIQVEALARFFAQIASN